jgi:hypothetical protein
MEIFPPIAVLTSAQYRGLPQVDAGIRAEWLRRLEGLDALERWPINLEPCDFTPDEWLSIWGPYPGPFRFIRPRWRRGAVHHLEIDGSSVVTVTTSRTSGNRLWSRPGRVLGLHDGALVVEMLDADGQPRQTQYG